MSKVELGIKLNGKVLAYPRKWVQLLVLGKKKKKVIGLNRHFSKKNIQLARKYRKKDIQLLIIIRH